MSVDPAASIALNPKELEALPTTRETRRAEEMVRDERVQRTLSAWFVERISGNLNIDAIGTIVASLRDNGDLIILDGGHRIEALLKLGMGDYEVDCIIHHGLDHAQEARLFLFYNNKRSVALAERFRIAVAAEDPESVTLNKLVNRAGFTLSPKAHNGLYCIGTLIDIYRGSKNSTKAHPNEVTKMLETLVEAWGTDGSATRETVSGIGSLYLTYGEGIDKDHLVEQLQRLRGGPAAIKTKSGQLYDLRVARTIREAALRAVLDVYNTGQRGGKRLSL